MEHLSAPALAITSETSPTVRTRVQAVDIVRGLVMVVMALDHIREFWSPTPVRPEDVAQASMLLFFTRWVTHFCAPTFVFLSGLSIFLYQQKQPNRGRVSRFLFTRGLWLVTLEMLVISLFLTWGYELVLLQVIWAIGWGMMLLAGLIWLPRAVLAVLSACIVLLHNLLPAIQPVTAGTLVPALLHNSPFVFPVPHLTSFLVAYTIGPWLGVMLAGYLVGPWFRQPLPVRQRWLRLAGLGLLLLFVVLRASNLYGDPAPWSVQPRGLAYSIASFLNVTKYPPSLLFISLTLGVALLLLSWVETASGRLSRWLSTFGQVPFFYYLLHLLLISGGAWVWTRLAFGTPINLGFTSSKDWPAAYQPSLLRAYVVWLLVIAALYWPCRWYRNFRHQHSYWWLSYL
ncbi:Uncharacterized membrane protein [Hymenobacter gelipurpurascens]|uniref:Uncharacterized membrane protein n=1 Tax=Hymenobacter gelipurpurascens TaxID=89968 RepID=A0A212TJD1_9BACT|nr:heparan-alpha-glucosaminide N-acetyltransferase domain-containing protein [Hymenobacter gelipurpurascens]SNC66169.1 Uncharacterized membrane protein [Hymenobacter gelipurpurascens]